MPIIKIDDLIIQKYDDVLADAFNHKYTHYTLYGGRGSTKSSFISIAIILLLTKSENKNVHAVVFRKTANTLRDSVYSQMRFAISALHLEKYFKSTVSPMEITYMPTGQKILFRGVDEPEKIKSIKAPFGYFGITFFEELDQYHGRAEIRTILQSTMRGKGGIFWNFESFNPPISANNWANTDILQPRQDRRIVKTSYLDVPKEWLSEQFFIEADTLREINERAYRHEYLGEAVGTGGNVFENISIREITDAEINTFDNCYYGLDWGWVHPAAFICGHYDPNHLKLYIYHEIYGSNISNRKMAEYLEPWKDCYITADSAEPKSIEDLRDWGYNLQPAYKPPGSREYSTKWLASLAEIIVDPKRCPNAARELIEYEYIKTKDGEITSLLPDVGEDCIAATRYALSPVWSKRGQ